MHLPFKLFLSQLTTSAKVLGQLQQQEKLGTPAVESPPRDVEENRAEVTFELVERLAEREERDWAYFGRLRHEWEKRLRDPQDVLIEADRLQSATEEGSGTATSKLRKQ